MLRAGVWLQQNDPYICGLAKCPAAAFASARRAPSKETLFLEPSVVGRLFGRRLFDRRSSVGRRSVFGWVWLLAGWLGWLLAGFLAGFWLGLAGFLAGFGWLFGWLLAGLAGLDPFFHVF